VSTHDTTTADLIPPGAEAHKKLNGSPVQQIARLKAYLGQAFPDEVERSNRQQPEHTADLAIRLLQGLSTTVHPSQLARCDQQYCNKPANHADEHGWINY
jgi:hypothetical protein